MRPSTFPAFACVLLGLALIGTSRLEAQHDPRRSLLAPPGAGEAMTRRVTPPPNRTLSPSVHSSEFLFGGAHDAIPSDTIDTGFLTSVGTTAPMSSEELRQSRGLAAHLCQRRCGRPTAAPKRAGTPPPELIGEFRDDYGNAFRISDSLFVQLPRMRFRIVEWNVPERFLIAQNDAENPSDAGLWTRIDWMPFSGMAPFTWGFCLTAYRAPTRVAARATAAADRSTPRTGCGGFPFSRMRRANDPA